MSYVYLGRSMNIENELKGEWDRRRRTAWAAFGPLREATDLSAHLPDSTALPALCYAAKTWVDTTTTSKTLRTVHRAFERSILRYNRRTRLRARLRSSDLRQISHLHGPAEYGSKATYRWADHTMRREDERCTKRTLEWIPRDDTTSREVTNEMGRRICHMDGSAERSAGNETNISSALATVLVDDDGKRKNRMDAMLGLAQQVKTGHLSI